MTPAFDLTDSTPPTPRMMPIFWYLPERARYRHYPSPDEDGDYGMDLGVKSDVPRLTRDVDWSESLSS
ncbi:hypothetical protein EW026_g5134 [Hermanssonia centrifuga]|uniref:Uncharacterized protein n=1 Tax=Hermanssonia centrifuga TaxID=98765 RepID=A0A4S4KFF9_9APHY|nr:hypothetical protein EW026_g5134 [Hermanssonia centrifuga]